jgi:hypothetical protein
MNVDAIESEPDLALLAAGLRVLQLRSYDIDSDLSVLVCVTCGTGVHPTSPIVHAQTHGIRLSKPAMAELNRFIPTLSLAGDNKDFPSPPPSQAPMDIVKLQDGLKCHACGYACRSTSSMDSHWSDDHKHEAKDYSFSNVQTVFSRLPVFFAVDPILKGLARDDLYRVYLAQFGPEMAKADASLPRPVSENEVSPLLRVTLWHEHLADYTVDKVSVRSVRLLLDTRIAGQKTPWLGKPLHDTVSGYMQDIRAKMKQIPIPARMLLMQYPV